MFIARLNALIEGRFLHVEDAGLDPGAGGGGGAPPEPAAAASTGLADAGDGVADDGASTAATSLPDNWRDLIAGEDAAVRRLLERDSSVEALGKRLVHQENLIKSGRYKQVQGPPEDATPEEIAAYRKAAGIPDAPEGYGLQFPQEAGATEADAAALSAFQQFMHERHIPPAAAKAAFEFYMQNTLQGRAALAEKSQEAALQNIEELRAEYKGREFGRNINLAEELIKGEGAFSHLDGPLFDPRAAQQIKNARVTLDDGTQIELRHYAPFVKGLVGLARQLADPDALIGGDGAGGGKSLADEKQELLNKSARGKLTQAEDARLNEIYEIQTRQQGRSRAA